MANPDDVTKSQEHADDQQPAPADAQQGQVHEAGLLDHLGGPIGLATGGVVGGIIGGIVDHLHQHQPPHEQAPVTPAAPSISPPPPPAATAPPAAAPPPAVAATPSTTGTGNAEQQIADSQRALQDAQTLFEAGLAARERARELYRERMAQQDAENQQMQQDAAAQQQALEQAHHAQGDAVYGSSGDMAAADASPTTTADDSGSSGSWGSSGGTHPQ